MSSKLWPLLGLMTLSPALAQTTPAAPLPPTAGELLRRVLSPDWSGGESRTDVLLGRVPADLGISLPTGSRVVGTVSTTFERADIPANTTVYFDTSLTPAQVTAHFTKTLGAAWKEAPGFLNGPYEFQGGFQPGPALGNLALYRSNPVQLLQITTRLAGGVTQVTLRKQQGGNTEQVLQSINSRPPAPPAFLVLPKLAAPSDSTVTVEGSGNTNDGASQSARIETKLSRRAVVEHYAGQLRQSGWRLMNQADTPQATTTVWSFTQNGAERVGLLIVTGTSPYRATLMTQGTR